MKNRKKPGAPQLRVVMSLHMPRPQHTTLAKASRLSGESLAEFIRKAASDRAARVLDGPPLDAAA
jgi:uncharacterized protein (DUF1778 family)